MFNISLFVTIDDQDNRTIEKFLILYIKDKMDFNLTLTNNKVIHIERHFLLENLILSDY